MKDIIKRESENLTKTSLFISRVEFGFEMLKMLRDRKKIAAGVTQNQPSISKPSEPSPSL